MTAASPRTRGRRVIAGFDSYGQAQRAVERLAMQRFPVEQITIVTRGLRLVEHVTGRRQPLRIALLGAVAGGAIGGVVGLWFRLLGWVDPLPVPAALLCGLVVGALAGLTAGGAASRIGRWRDFSTVGSVQADRYELLCDAGQAEEATRQLG